MFFGKIYNLHSTSFKMENLPFFISINSNFDYVLYSSEIAITEFFSDTQLKLGTNINIQKITPEIFIIESDTLILKAKIRAKSIVIISLENKNYDEF